MDRKATGWRRISREVRVKVMTNVMRRGARWEDEEALLIRTYRARVEANSMTKRVADKMLAWHGDGAI